MIRGAVKRRASSVLWLFFALWFASICAPVIVHARITSDRIALSGDISNVDEYDISSPRTARDFTFRNIPEGMEQISGSILQIESARMESDSFEAFLAESQHHEESVAIGAMTNGMPLVSNGSITENPALASGNPVIVTKPDVANQQEYLANIGSVHFFSEGMGSSLHYHSIRQGYIPDDSLNISIVPLPRPSSLPSSTSNFHLSQNPESKPIPKHVNLRFSIPNNVTTRASLADAGIL